MNGVPVNWYRKRKLLRKVKKFNWKRASELGLFVGDYRYWESGSATIAEYIAIFDHMERVLNDL